MFTGRAATQPYCLGSVTQVTMPSHTDMLGSPESAALSVVGECSLGPSLVPRTVTSLGLACLGVLDDGCASEASHDCVMPTY